MRISDWSSDVCSSDLPEETLTQGLHGSLRDPRRKVTDAWRCGLKELTAKTPGLIIGQPTIDLAAATHALFTARFQWAIASDDNSPGQALKRDSIKTKIGRASCRERVCQVRVDLGGRRIIKKQKKKKNINTKH